MEKRVKKGKNAKTSARDKKAQKKKDLSKKSTTVTSTSNKSKDTKLKKTVKKVYGTAEKKKKDTKTKKVKKPEFKYNKSEYAKLKEEFSNYNSKALQEALKMNRQPSTGTKDQLIQRCTEGKLFGAIPKCPKCFAGNPRFDLKTGTYKCPGFMDDTTFKNCGWKGEYNDIERTTWQ
jgi:hypothetical protein